MVAFLRGLVVGTIVCGLPYWLYATEFPPLVATAGALVFAAAGLAIIDAASKWRAGAGAGAGITVPILATIIWDYQSDPTSHNLAPFEIIMGLAFAMPAALLGAWIGGLVARTGQAAGWIGGGLIAAGLLVASAHAIVTRAETVGQERDAEARLRALLAAEHGFRVSDAGSGYNCDLDRLYGDFDAPAQTYEPSRPVAGIYGSGTQAMRGDYAFTLLCSVEAKPERFMLSAMPVQSGHGRWVYCAEAEGGVRKVKRSRYNYCLAEGVPTGD